MRGVCREAADSGYDTVVIKDDSIEVEYKTEKLLEKLREDVEFEELLGVRTSEKRTFQVEYKL